MELFLTETRNQLTTNNFSKLNIVLGNESCDLDSAICALVYAAFLKWQHEKIKCKNKRDESTYRDETFVPILNVDRADYELKTEVVYCLSEAGVSSELLIFRDDFNFNQLAGTNPTSVLLVDHHVLAGRDRHLADKVVEVIDHRPLDNSGWKYSPEARPILELTGSCASLVVDRIRSLSALLKGRSPSLGEGMLENCRLWPDLMHSTIILDTVNFSREVNKATRKDEEMVLYLETVLKPENVEEFRRSKLDRLVQARTDVSRLSVESLLKKDVKIVGDVLVPSFPILVEQILKKDKAKDYIDAALVLNNCKIALLLGMKLDGGLERDAAIYSSEGESERAIQLSNILKEWSKPNLQLSREEVKITNCIYYRQQNKSASRKQYMVALNTFLGR